MEQAIKSGWLAQPLIRFMLQSLARANTSNMISLNTTHTHPPSARDESQRQSSVTTSQKGSVIGLDPKTGYGGCSQPGFHRR